MTERTKTIIAFVAFVVGFGAIFSFLYVEVLGMADMSFQQWVHGTGWPLP